MSSTKPTWWNTRLPWRALNPQLPVANSLQKPVTGIVVHPQGRYGWNRGNWVDDDPEGYAVHYGLDIIGWLGSSGSRPLDKHSICCSPAQGIVAWTGPDEHGFASIIVRHSARSMDRRRFSFFGDLEEVFVKKGQEVERGTPLGPPLHLRRKGRFFHFSLGYEIRRNGRWQDVFIDPGFSLNGKIVVRRPFP